MAGGIITLDQLSSKDTDLPTGLRQELAQAEQGQSRAGAMSVSEVVDGMQGALLSSFNLAAQVVQKKLDSGQELTIAEVAGFLSAQAEAAKGMAALANEQRVQRHLAQQEKRSAEDVPHNNGQYL